MNAISYDRAALAVRPDITAAHIQAWQRLGRPGTWLTAAQRLAVAAEVRRAPDCGPCHERKAALSPNAVAGQHDSGGELDDTVVEVIHRVRTDSGRLSESWLRGLLEGGLSDAEYIEIVGVLVTVVSIDTFARALGVAAHQLPPAEKGEPSRRRPPEAAPGGAWVPWIEPEDAATSEADLYAGFFVTNVRKALSLVPDEVRSFFGMVHAQYLPPDAMTDPATQVRAISRPQIELIAGRVSALNQCFY